MVAQLVKKPSAVQETLVLFLSWDDLLEKGKATYPLQYSGLENSMDRIPEWVAFPFSRRFSQARGRTQVFHIAGGFFTS